MIQMKCDSCGGQLERDESQVFVSKNAVIIKAGCGFECQHCGNRFLPGTEHAVSSGDNITVVGNGAVATRGGVAVSGGGSIAIQGNVGGDVVVGNKRVLFDTRGAKVNRVTNL